MSESEDKNTVACRLRSAEFARMSTSKKLSLLAIRKAQSSSRRVHGVIDSAAAKKNPGVPPRPKD